ncbi:DUF1080 domain-containing protein, partial [Candidatus Sumerlaeota bacterium]|nr:DUF1080 domain-containing protein [Candidatus Sumerlaeota bacterium]
TIFAAYKERDWNDMVVIARGNQLIQKINGVVFSEIIDEQEGARATSGVLALQLHAGPPMVVEFKDIRLKPLAPEGPIALFNGKDLTGWRVLDQADFSEHGKVYVKDGVLHLDAGKPMTGVGYTGEIPTSNYEVSFDAMRTDGYDFFCGMTFPVGSSWLTWIIGGWGGTVVGFSNVDDMNASENETSRGRSFDNNHWYHFDLRVTDKEIEASIDGDTIITLAREGRRFSVWEEQSPIKPFGIATWYTGGAVRNLTLKRLE